MKLAAAVFATEPVSPARVLSVRCAGSGEHTEAGEVTLVTADETLLQRCVCRRYGRQGRTPWNQDVRYSEDHEGCPAHILESDGDAGDETELSLDLAAIQVLQHG